MPSGAAALVGICLMELTYISTDWYRDEQKPRAACGFRQRIKITKHGCDWAEIADAPNLGCGARQGDASQRSSCRCCITTDNCWRNIEVAFASAEEVHTRRPCHGYKSCASPAQNRHRGQMRAWCVSDCPNNIKRSAVMRSDDAPRTGTWMYP